MKQMTIRKRLIGITIVFVLIIITLSFYYLNRFGVMSRTYRQIQEVRTPQLIVANAIAEVLIGIRMNVNEMNSVEISLENYKQYRDRAIEKFEEFQMLSGVMINGSSAGGKTADNMNGVKVPPCRKGGEIEKLTAQGLSEFKKYKKVCEEIMSLKKEQLQLVNAIGFFESENEKAGTVMTLVELGRKMEKMTDDPEQKLLIAEIRRQEKNCLQRAEILYCDKMKKVCHKLEDSSVGDLREMAVEYRTLFEKIIDKVIAEDKLREQLKNLTRTELRNSQKLVNDSIDALKDRASNRMEAYAAQAVDMERSVRTNIIIVALVVSAVSLLLGWWVSSGINRVLKRIISDLDAGSEQVAAASSEVSSASQQLAEGASENAASLEETSASLEEMTSMTRQNADNATQADTLMKESGVVVLKAGRLMSEMNHSMDEISSSGQEIGRIIKTIDEIAFQTNLLALNAAVEAARAGEAGQGFAVVADEVRNLAQRAAQAAKNTAELIETTINKIDQGAGLVKQTDEAFSEVSASAEKVGELVGEIAAASSEQSQGIDQINTALTQMDSVTQQNAANAEESAGSSEELSAQAEKMRELVAELVKLVSGENGVQRSLPSENTRPGMKHHQRPGRDEWAPAERQTLNSPQRIVQREALIPMDDDFNDY